MSSLKISLPKKYRPKQIQEIIGHQQIKSILINILKNDIKFNALLFYGDRGSGKTSLARILAAALNCSNPIIKENIFEPCNQCQSCITIQNNSNLDVIEIDAASNNSIENIRDLIENAKYLPQQGIKKIYILDEVHMLSLSAFNGLLKILEEPPEHTYFILITTEYQKLPLTIISRCMRLNFRKLDTQDIANHLKFIALQENIIAEDKTFKTLAYLSTGSVRDGISMLDSCAILTNNQIKWEDLVEILGIDFNIQDIFYLLILILQNNHITSLEIAKKIYKQNTNIESLIKNILDFLSELIVAKALNDSGEIWQNHQTFQIISLIDKEQLENFLKAIDHMILDQLWQIFSKTNHLLQQGYYENNWNLLQISIIKALYFINQYLINEEKKQQINNLEINYIQNTYKDYLNQEIKQKPSNLNIETIKIETHNIEKNELIISRQDNNIDEKIDLKQIFNKIDNSVKNQLNNNQVDFISRNFNLEELLQFLQENQELMLYSLIKEKKIILDEQELKIIDLGNLPNKYLQSLLKILRTNFNKNWKIYLADINEYKNIHKKNNPEELKINFLQSDVFKNLSNHFNVLNDDVKILK